MTAALILVILDLGDSALLAALFAPPTVSRTISGLTARQQGRMLETPTSPATDVT